MSETVEKLRFREIGKKSGMRHDALQTIVFDQPYTRSRPQASANPDKLTQEQHGRDEVYLPLSPINYRLVDQT